MGKRLPIFSMGWNNDYGPVGKNRRGMVLFDANGVMQRGWLWKSGGWYYLDEETGVMQKGWIKIEKDEYF